MRRLFMMVMLIVAAGIAWHRCSPVQRPPGVLTKMEPRQVLLNALQPIIKKGEWRLQPVATFSVEARVLGMKRYTDDFTAELSPVDLALGWGRMSDSAVLDKLSIDQSNRFYRWQYWGSAPIPDKEIISSSANMHIIPADDSIGARLSSLRVGELIKLSGVLVIAEHPKADKPWRTSLTRDDKGEGACEVFYVKALSVQ